MTSNAPRDLLPRTHDEVRLRGNVATNFRRGTDPHGPTDPRGWTGSGSPGAPPRRDPAHTDEGDTSLAPHGPATRRTVTADPAVSLGSLGWLVVLLAAVLLTVLAHAASVRSGQAEHHEPSLLADPAYVLALRQSQP